MKYKRLVNNFFSPIAKAYFNVRKLDDPEVVAHRRSVCDECPQRDKDYDMCNVCGCFINAKIEMAINRHNFTVQATHCPLGKWGPEDKRIANTYRELKGEALID